MPSNSQPISIDTANTSPRGRPRSSSMISTASSLSSMPGLSPTSSRGSPPPGSASAILTPTLPFRTGAAPGSPTGANPLSAYFLAGSPTKTPFRSFAPTIVDEDTQENETPHHGHHHRRMSSSWAQGHTRFNSAGGPTSGSSSENHERGVGVLRRLSLGAAFVNRPSAATHPTRRPSTPPAPGTPPKANLRNKRRTATISEAPKKRSVSPMGERMLKGHFDGFGF